MFALLILPILISGFIVLSISPSEKLKLHRYDGQLLYLKAAKIGLRYFIVITIFSFFMKKISFDVTIPSVFLNVDTDNEFTTLTIDPALVTHIAKGISAITNGSTISSDILELSWLLSLSFLTIGSAYFISLVKSLSVKIQNKILKRLYGNSTLSIILLGRILKDSPIDYMFYESFAIRKPILISLKNRKVYIGFVNKLGEPSESEAPNQEISLVPAISGYRNKDTQKVVLQNDYSIPEEFDSSIVIKVDEIETVSWFNYGVYQGVNGNINNSPSTLLPAIKNRVTYTITK
ncbi:hypothetical protein [Moritella viscosa]|uniref:hypothetical protein n=1 Tax=Moritella viscosa TaxID=80854 RepID=UPI0009146F78|nr:hypothetical protein [Moritella viscosa]SGZ08228.1 Putative uncharacterized protein [Moritella viscosa]